MFNNTLMNRATFPFSQEGSTCTSMAKDCRTLHYLLPFWIFVWGKIDSPFPFPHHILYIHTWQPIDFVQSDMHCYVHN